MPLSQINAFLSTLCLSPFLMPFSLLYASPQNLCLSIYLLPLSPLNAFLSKNALFPVRHPTLNHSLPSISYTNFPPIFHAITLKPDCSAYSPPPLSTPSALI